MYHKIYRWRGGMECSWILMPTHTLFNCIGAFILSLKESERKTGSYTWGSFPSPVLNFFRRVGCGGETLEGRPPLRQFPHLWNLLNCEWPVPSQFKRYVVWGGGDIWARKLLLLFNLTLSPRWFTAQTCDFALLPALQGSMRASHMCSCRPCQCGKRDGKCRGFFWHFPTTFYFKT